MFTSFWSVFGHIVKILVIVSCYSLQKILNTFIHRLVVLDEMDQLNSNDFEVLYKLFDLVSVRNSRIIMIGIANSLDLTDRMLPRYEI